MRHFLKEQDRTSADTRTDMHTQNDNNTGLPLSKPFGSGEKKGECENEWVGEKKPRMRCVIHPHHRGLGQLRDKESLPIVHTCHTHTHMSDKKAASSTAEPNMLQHLPKKSENECKLRLFYPPLPHCLTLVIKSLSAVMWVHSTPTVRRCHQKSK